MTVDTFLKEIKKSGIKFELEFGTIRAENINNHWNYKACPIEVLGFNGKTNNPCGLGRSIDLLELKTNDVNKIITAADGAGQPKLRKELLKACGLTE